MYVCAGMARIFEFACLALTFDRISRCKLRLEALEALDSRDGLDSAWKSTAGGLGAAHTLGRPSARCLRDCGRCGAEIDQNIDRAVLQHRRLPPPERWLTSGFRIRFRPVGKRTRYDSCLVPSPCPVRVVGRAMAAVIDKGHGPNGPDVPPTCVPPTTDRHSAPIRDPARGTSVWE